MYEDEELEDVQLDEEEEQEEGTPLIVVMEDDIVHNGTSPCGDPTCPCATLGYPV